MSFGSGAGAAEGGESVDDAGRTWVGSGRGSDTGGRRETYFRAHDPAAPGSTAPTFGEAFRYHSGIGGAPYESSTGEMKSQPWGGKHTPGQMAARTIFGMLAPGGGLMLAAGAAIDALTDVRGGPGSFGTGGSISAPVGPGADMEPAYEQRRGVVRTPAQKTSATGTGTGTGTGTSTQGAAIPKSVTGVSAPERKATGTGRQGTLANVATTPFGILGDAPVARKLLLGR